MSARRASVTSRRRSSGSSTRLLGAVKLQSPLSAAAGDAGSPMSSSSEPTSAQATPQNQSPLVDASVQAAARGPSAAVAAADGLAEFSWQLTTSRSADRWLEERLTAGASSQGARHQGTSPSPLGQQPVESAATQIVHKALRFITDQAPSPPPPGAADPAANMKPSFDSHTFLDKGMDAISGVGKLMEGFAITLDTVIGQAFEDWGTTLQPSRPGKPARRLPGAPSSSGAAAAGQRAVVADTSASGAGTLRAEQGARRGLDAAGDKENAAGVARVAGKQQAPRAAGRHAAVGQGGVPSSRQPHITSFMSKLDAASEEEVAEWRRRAQQLASELQRVRAQQEEYQRLRLQYDKLEADLQQASTAASRLAQENCELKSLGGAPVDSALGGADPLAAQQVAKQMEALLQEKSKLAQENDRLLRENSGLQELLEFTLQHHAQLAGDNELFGYDEGEEAGEVVLPSPMDQSPPASEAGADEGTGVSTGAATLAAVPASA